MHIVASFLILFVGSLPAFAQAIDVMIPDVAYQARSAATVPGAKHQGARTRLEEFVSLPSPPRLAVPPLAIAKPEPEPTDVWERIRRHFAMPKLTGPLVDREIQTYLRRPEVLKAILQRSRRYLYHIVTELERRKFPMELALLPMVESGYNPHALSSAQASGLWQFIPDTGKRYDLPQTKNYDARRDIIASTRAALDYLQFLYGLTGDWHLALASYNWGEQAVLAAMERNRNRGRPVDYQALTLPEETRMYLPKLQALRNIIADPEAYGLTLEPVPNEPYFVAVDNMGRVDVRAAAKLAEMSFDEFIALNPAFNSSTISNADTSLILLPVDKVETFQRNIQNARFSQHSRARGPNLRGLARIDAPPGSTVHD